MTRHDAAQPGGDDLARAAIREHQGPPATPGVTLRHARGQLERPPVAGRLRPGTHREPARVQPIRPAAPRTHRLLLEGELGPESAVALEAEIEALCASGIDELLLDLSGLRGIDATGALVLATRGELCRKRGVAIELVGVDVEVRRAFVAAGLRDPAAGDGDENPQRKEAKIGQKG